jgi:hypothetical protein
MKQQALLPATDEMQDCCALLTREMLHWPGVKMYHLFGTHAFYHRKVMFAVLPGKRSLDRANTITFKTIAASHSDSDDAWHTVELNNCAVQDALASLEKAYEDSKFAVALPAVTAGI